MQRLNRTVLLIVVFTLILSCFTVAFGTTDEEEEKDRGLLGNMIHPLIMGAFNGSADFLSGLGLKTESVMLPNDEGGKQTASPFMFSFSTNNIFGAFTSVVYPVFFLIGKMIISIMVCTVGIKFISASNGVAKETAMSSLKTLAISTFVLFTLPDLLAIFFDMRDSLAVGLNEIFSGQTGGTGFVDAMATTAKASGASILDALLYLGATLFSFAMMINYLGLSLGFAVLLLMTPVVVVLTPMNFAKQTFSEIGKNIFAYGLTPIIDITLLGIVSITRGLAGTLVAANPGLDPILFDIASVVFVFMIMPIRASVKQLLGVRGGMGEMMGASMLMTAMAVGRRTKNHAKGSFSGARESSKEAKDYKQKEKQERDIAEYESVSGNTESSSDLGSIDTSSATDISSTSSTDIAQNSEAGQKREELINEHFGKPGFDEKTVGGMSHEEKAEQYKRLRKESKKNVVKSIGKDTVGTLGGFAGGIAVGGAGAIVGSYLGTPGVMAGAMVGGKVGSTVSRNAARVAYEATDRGSQVIGNAIVEGYSDPNIDHNTGQYVGEHVNSPEVEQIASTSDNLSAEHPMRRTQESISVTENITTSVDPIGNALEQNIGNESVSEAKVVDDQLANVAGNANTEKVVNSIREQVRDNMREDAQIKMAQRTGADVKKEEKEVVITKKINVTLEENTPTTNGQEKTTSTETTKKTIVNEKVEIQSSGGSSESVESSSVEDVNTNSDTSEEYDINFELDFDEFSKK